MKTARRQICETNFYSGEFYLLRDAREEAARLFRLATDGCPRTITEWAAANAHLKAFGKP